VDRQSAAACLIALTGYGQEEDRRCSKEAGFDHHLTKPADPALVQSLLAGPL
jgi:CheY-like chemotaxis protein